MLQRSLRAAFTAFAVLAFASQAFAIDVGSIVNQVNQKTYATYLSNSLYTRTGNNRGEGGAQHDLARTNIYNAFSSFGLSTYLDPFSFGNSTCYNVVGVHQGKVHPDQYYIVGAHYDSAGTPGADDNASGTAGVMEAARVLSKYDFDATLIFIGFDREEQGLWGSRAYVNSHKTSSILGMLSLDMIAYNPTGPEYNTAYIYGRTTSNPVKNSLADAIRTYSDGITPIVQGDMSASDHAAFEERGFQAALLIESGVWSNPYYHQPSDSTNTPNYIDYTYATRMTRGAVGYLATAAGPVVPEPGSLLSLGVGSVWVLLLVRRKQLV